MKRYSRIFLTGFMGAGKSTMGLIVANSLGWQFIDLDREIEQISGLKVPEYFKVYGEDSFRELETSTLISLSQQERIVIALGGGAILKEINLRTIKNSGLLVYLKASPEQIYYRLRYKLDRPLFQTPDQKPMSRDEALAKINRLLNEREEYYGQADLVFESENAAIGKAVDSFIKIVSRQVVK